MENQTPNYTQELEKPKKSIWKKILIGIAIFAVVLAGIIAIAMMATAESVKISDQYLAHLQAGKPSEMYAMMYPHESVTQEKINAMVDKIGPILTGEPQIIGREAHSNSSTGTFSSITYLIESIDEESYVVTIELLKDSNDEWKVLTFDSKRR